jgi:hypothetical protein
VKFEQRISLSNFPAMGFPWQYRSLPSFISFRAACANTELQQRNVSCWKDKMIISKVASFMKSSEQKDASAHGLR